MMCMVLLKAHSSQQKQLVLGGGLVVFITHPRFCLQPVGHGVFTGKMMLRAGVEFDGNYLSGSFTIM